MNALSPTELVTAIQESRARWEGLLANVSEEQLNAPRALGDWSMKEVLAHLAAWEAELATALARLKNGQQPAPLPASLAEILARNAEFARLAAERSADQVLADWRAVRQQTLRQINKLSAADLATACAWADGETLGRVIDILTVEHDNEHWPHLQAWRATWNQPTEPPQP